MDELKSKLNEVMVQMMEMKNGRNDLETVMTVCVIPPLCTHT